VHKDEITLLRGGGGGGGGGKLSIGPMLIRVMVVM